MSITARSYPKATLSPQRKSLLVGLVERLLQAQVDYLKARQGITRLVLPQLPVIPLSMHTEEFEFTAEQRADARTRRGGAEGLA